MLLGVCAGAAGLVILVVALACRSSNLLNLLDFCSLRTNEDKHCQLVAGQEGAWEEAQLWCEAILGAADFPQLQEADAGT